MGWPATERFELVVAPGGLALIQDLLNTRSARRPPSPDLLSTVAQAQAWADEALEAWALEAGQARRRARLTRADVEQLRTLRDQLVAAVRAPGGPVPDALLGLSVRSARGADGALLLEPVGRGWELVAGAVLLELHRARELDTWRRVKTCRNEACPGTFYDRSPNNSGAWHDVRSCGNVANLRAARARRRLRATSS
ncbi:CGNR zinc finger domain-containing protein [Pseudonocardia dioxanivorans]|uniref:CGNR zinc finger domain-containing protein n=1 Tax=Pseudonocardia dioxanivorans TaxID=240495 RepID=UPI000CD297A0|nr:CGNR zinc finger domain-containing protein [Pseudonocardia dioxanivorans]